MEYQLFFQLFQKQGLHCVQFLNYHNLKDRAETAKEEGAQCVIFYTDNKHAETLTKKFKKTKESGIRVLFLNDHKEIVLNKRISFELNLEEKKTQGKNLIAYINNQQQNTINVIKKILQN